MDHTAFGAVFHIPRPLLDWKVVIWGRADRRFHRGSHHGVFPGRFDTDRRFRCRLHERFFRPFPIVGRRCTRPARSLHHPLVRLLRYNHITDSFFFVCVHLFFSDGLSCFLFDLQRRTSWLFSSRLSLFLWLTSSTRPRQPQREGIHTNLVYILAVTRCEKKSFDSVLFFCCCHPTQVSSNYIAGSLLYWFVCRDFGWLARHWLHRSDTGSTRTQFHPGGTVQKCDGWAQNLT